MLSWWSALQWKPCALPSAVSKPVLRTRNPPPPPMQRGTATELSRTVARVTWSSRTSLTDSYLRLNPKSPLRSDNPPVPGNRQSVSSVVLFLPAGRGNFEYLTIKLSLEVRPSDPCSLKKINKNHSLAHLKHSMASSWNPEQVGSGGSGTVLEWR